jgi:hypothetical protein
MKKRLFKNIFILLAILFLIENSFASEIEHIETD